MSKLQVGGSGNGNGTSVKTVPGTNGISSDGGEEVKIVGAESAHNLDIFNGDLKAPKRNFPYSSYLVGTGSNSEQGVSVSLKRSALIESGVGDIIISASAKGLEKQNSSCNRVMKDSEISIFQAEKYFSEDKIDSFHESRTGSSKPGENSKAKRQESKNKALFYHQDSYDSRHRMASPAASIRAVNYTFRPGGVTPTGSPTTSRNSRSGLLSNSVHKLAATDRRRPSSKWRFGCKCLCLNKNSAAMDNTLTENRRASSLSNSMTPSLLMDSPVSSIKYSYAGLRRRVLSRLIEKHREKAFADNASELSDFNCTTNGESGLKAPASSLVDNFPESGLSKDRELQKRIQGISPRFMAYDMDSDRAELGERTHQRKMNGSFLEKKHDISFPIPSEKSEEISRPSLEVFGSPFPGTPDHADSCNSTTVMGIHHQMQPSDLQRHLVLFSLDKAKKSFTFNSNSDTHKFSGPGKKSLEDIDQDKESDSSSDLFEIENLNAQFSFRKREFLDNNPRIRCFPGSFHLECVENTHTASAKSYCYEPSEASVDWSITTGDTMEKVTLENFSSENEESKKHASLNGLDLSRLRNATMTEDSKIRSRKGSFLSCASEKSVRVAVPIEYSHSARYSYEKKGSFTSRFSK
ncbi:hypothetical protein SUGI_1063230 [Cryptomeria japonica]|uniref:uncharacterized protein LOC131028455 n=1 Tax=Cryptomeria japonica TaxID=3369 RepID=UPI002414B649|nr:uncharacterized protein LOC131028455 [Cryptomeria japonica]GLJ49992.1 hypothetical protein SUGI_1063230 [Cryptomeria japonica]